MTIIEQIQKQDGTAYSDYMYFVCQLADFIVAAKCNCKISDLTCLSDEDTSEVYVYKSEEIQKEFDEVYDQLDSLIRNDFLEINEED
jgi:hypothetical protein